MTGSEDLPEGLHDGVGLLVFVEMLQHQNCGEEQRRGIGDVPSRDVWRGAVHRFEHTDPVLAERLAAIGQIASASTPVEFSAAIEAQRAKIASIVKLTGSKPMQ